MQILTLTFYLILILINFNSNFVSGANENAGELECTLPSNKLGQCRKLTDCPTLLKAVRDNHIEKNEDRIKEYLFKYRCKEVVDKREFCCPDFVSNEEAPEEILIFPDVSGTDQVSSSTVSSTVETSEPTSSESNESSEVPSSTTTSVYPSNESPSYPSYPVEPIVENVSPTSEESVENESSISSTEDAVKETPSSTTEAISSSTEPATVVPLIDATNEESESEKVDAINSTQEPEPTTVPETPSLTIVDEVSARQPSEYSENVDTPTTVVNLIGILSGPVPEIPVEVPVVEISEPTTTPSPAVISEEPVVKNCGVYNGNNEGFFPWSVMLARQNELPCFGTIMSDRVILSTAECVDKTMEVIKLIKEGPACSFIIFPCTYMELDIETTVKHPNYEPGNDEFNIGLIKLRSPLTFDNNVSPICMPENNAELSKENTQSMVTYLTSVTEIFAQNTSNVQLQTEGQCREKLSADAFKPDNLCSVFAEELDADQTIFTQYGSPLQVKSGSQYYLYGIGVGQETRRSPQKFISVPFYFDWIKSNSN